MKFSVICVYNDVHSFNENLLKSLRNQTFKDFQLIEIDNSDKKFDSAPKALNYGAAKAAGDYLIFVHQDIFLYSEKWLESVARILDSKKDTGIAGCVGVDRDGRKLGYIKDRYSLWGEPFYNIQEAETLDECILIIPKKIFESYGGFDEKLGSWHCYGAEYSIRMSLNNKKVYVIPAFIIHNSPTTNLKSLADIQYKLYDKYKREIHTTSGVISKKGILKQEAKLNPVLDIFRPAVIKAGAKFNLLGEMHTLSNRIQNNHNIQIFHLLKNTNINSQYIVPLNIKCEKLLNNRLWKQQNINHFFITYEEIYNLYDKIDSGNDLTLIDDSIYMKTDHEKYESVRYTNHYYSIRIK